MFIVMHCGGMPFNGETLRTQSLGGSESAAYYLAKELSTAGHKVTLFTNSQQEGEWDGVRYLFAGEPANGAALGDRFHFYAEHTPHDVCIIQRHPQAFARKLASKINLWWLHDLALARDIPIVNSQLWNVDAILAVSDWHASQINAVYGYPLDRIVVVRNGVDQALYQQPAKLPQFDADKINLIYTSRPERGLEHLVRSGGIMERLEKEAPGKFMLRVAMYANFPPHMADFYRYIDDRIMTLPNATNAGCLDKRTLAQLQVNSDAWVYPTEFEEVSCITAMEALCAGLQVVCSDSAAIGETLREAGCTTQLIPLKDGIADEDAFVERLLGLSRRSSHVGADVPACSWQVGAVSVMDAIARLFKEAQTSSGAIARHLIRMSDIYALDYWRSKKGVANSIAAATIDEMDECYQFAFTNTWSEHYKNYYQYEKDRGVEYGPEELAGSTRFEGVSLAIEKALSGVVDPIVMDYGCAHGHYTINLAKRFPGAKFVGVDITASNIEKAKAWASDEGITNVEFYHCVVDDIATTVTEGPFDAIIAAEVLEHLEDAAGTVDKLATFLTRSGTMILTTPFGPWEYLGAIEHYPWRAHVHHFERADLHELWGMHDAFSVQVAVASATEAGETLGSYITTFKKPTRSSGKVDYDRKLRETVPRQTVSLCMIVKNGEESLLKAVKSVISWVDEVVIGVDKTTDDSTEAVIDRCQEMTNGCPVPSFTVIDIDSPLETGFDAARNAVIAKAAGDWILWFDSDEHVEGAAQLQKYLRNNHYNGYAVDHIHLSVDPPGALRIDKPTRVFRNNKGIRFLGVVHEHPEIEMNKGVGHAVLVPDVKVSHVGYSTEPVRIRRFMRNISLMARDREKYPDRQLGKFLWIRDLSMMCRFDMQHNGGHVTAAILQRAEAGTKLYEELIGTADERMLFDGLEYYTALSALLGGVEMHLQLGLSKQAGGLGSDVGPAYRGVFRTAEQARRLVNRVMDERTKGYESKYI